MNGPLLLLACVLFSAGASFFLKMASSSNAGDMGFVALVANPMIWVGGVLYVAAFLGYIYVLRLVPLSLAQPVITAGVSVVTALMAASILREQMTWINWSGLFLICIGMVFLSVERG